MATVTALRKPKTQTIGGLTDQMFTNREERRKLTEREKELNAEFEVMEAQLIELLDAQETIAGKGTLASATIKTATNYSFDQEVDDKGDDGFTRFMKFVAKSKLFHLVQRRVSAPGIEEVVKIKGKLPDGLASFSKRTVSIRKL